MIFFPLWCFLVDGEHSLSLFSIVLSLFSSPDRLEATFLRTGCHEHLRRIGWRVPPDWILDDIGISLVESSLPKWVRASKCHWDQSTLIQPIILVASLLGIGFSAALTWFPPADRTVSTPPLRHSKGLDRIVKAGQTGINQHNLANTWLIPAR